AGASRLAAPAPGDGGGGRGAPRGPSDGGAVISDVARVRTMAVVAGGAALATALAIALVPAPPEAAAGALALPHAGLDCSSCHAAEPARSACVGCHGPHPSRRAGHRDLACTSCH